MLTEIGPVEIDVPRDTDASVLSSFYSSASGEATLVPSGSIWAARCASLRIRILTGLLREELGYDGVIVTDWGLITDVEIMGKPFPARAWGLGPGGVVNRSSGWQESSTPALTSSAARSAQTSSSSSSLQGRQG